MGAALYVCRGCGREAADPVGDLEALRERGFISCCPDREVVQVGPCLFPQPSHVKAGKKSVVTGGLAGLCFREEFDTEVFIYGVYGLDAPGALPMGGSGSFVAYGRSYEQVTALRGGRW